MTIGASITSLQFHRRFSSLFKLAGIFQFFPVLSDLLDGQMGKQIYFVLFKHVFEIGITSGIIHRM